MLLVTTADEATWGRDEDILFLGEWCLIAGRETALEGRRYRILPYHWDDREALRRDADLLQARYEDILPRLAFALNAIHGTQRNLGYWRLIAGPWLLWMMSVVWDRRENLRRAIDAGATETLVAHEVVLPSARFELLGPLSARNDAWNHALCARLLEEFSTVTRRHVAGTASLPNSDAPENQRRNGFAKRLARVFARRIPQRVAFVSMHVKPSMQLRLQLSQGQLPLPLSPPALSTFCRNNKLREALLLECGVDGFGAALARIIPETFPDVLLEGYSATRALALKSFPAQPKLIVTANAQYNEAFCIWVGEHRGRVPLILLQHGGHYGVDRVEMMEDHELAVADRYCSWGWTREGRGNIVPMPAFKLQVAQAMPAPDPRRGLVAVYDAAHRYPNRLYEVPIAGQRRVDNARQLQLLEALPEGIRGQLRLRCHPQDDGYGFRVALEKIGLSRQFDKSRDMLSAIKSARLCLIGSNSTPLLEALCSGTPTMAFYDSRFAEERDEAKPFFDDLRAAGIIHVDPLNCAAAIAQIWGDPMTWWNGPKVLAARSLFIARFACTSPKYLGQWRRFLANPPAVKF